MGATAIVRVALDNERNCKFQQIILDTATFCFVNECEMMQSMGNFAMNWAEDIYAFNMIWTTIVSGFYGANDLESCYHYYYKLGESTAILLDDIIGFKPKDAYEYKNRDEENMD